jgi:hypothetical protein
MKGSPVRIRASALARVLQIVSGGELWSALSNARALHDGARMLEAVTAFGACGY